MNHSTFQRSEIQQIRLHVLPTDRFKTYAISAFIGAPLREEQVTSTALIPFVLRRGTQSYPETRQFRQRLDELYGAGFGFDIYKRGNYQMIQFRLDIIEERYISGSDSLLKQGLDFLGEVITLPAEENGKFLSKYVDSEKQTLEKRIKSIINDKIRYAAERCLEEMFKGDPYRLHPLGRLEDLPELEPDQLYQAYQQWLAESPIDLYVIGNTTLEEVEAMVSKSFQIRRAQNPAYDIAPAEPREQREINEVVERLEVSQGKLNMGLKGSVTYAEDGYADALMYNGILGAYPHSKLFINVREKASLAYYASSRLDGHKGILTIQSGIEIENFEKAVDIIRKQLNAMSQGEISELEMSQTKAMIVNQLKEIKDAAFEIIAFDFNNILSGRERTVNELITDINGSTLESVREAASRMQLDTIYFLRDKEGK
ncbi:EF-P 5-aminopentanol modification-associated protein YfmF [Paenibacillus senegalensis]|uniref:EF-P 5-aminopentanol modification-associated protein YfmF n=1 Tax=Paenibacillus senegalensis TaxID=1465766 RepID=UPI00028991A8|nr:pitrilysin family protein [Paenibacillus senegalensis]